MVVGLRVESLTLAQGRGSSVCLGFWGFGGSGVWGLKGPGQTGGGGGGLEGLQAPDVKLQLSPWEKRTRAALNKTWWVLNIMVFLGVP